MKAIIKRLKSKTYRVAIVGALVLVVEHNSGFFASFLPESVRALAVMLWPVLMITLREVTIKPLDEKLTRASLLPSPSPPAVSAALGRFNHGAMTPRRKPVSNSNSKTSASPPPATYDFGTSKLMRRTKQKLVLATCAWMLLALAMLLSGCGHQPTQPCEPLVLPKRPALSEPLPSESYSKRAQQNIQNWQKRLDATSTISKNSQAPGPKVPNLRPDQ